MSLWFCYPTLFKEFRFKKNVYYLFIYCASTNTFPILTTRITFRQFSREKNTTFNCSELSFLMFTSGENFGCESMTGLFIQPVYGNFFDLMIYFWFSHLFTYMYFQAGQCDLFQRHGLHITPYI